MMSIQVFPGSQIPEPYERVLARLSHLNSLGTSHWDEVVFHDGDCWRSYYGSKTFKDGERVEEWVYVSHIWTPKERGELISSGGLAP